jgi:transposase-like protein
MLKLNDLPVSNARTPAWHAGFLAMTPAIHRHAQRALRRFRAEVRADAVQEVLAGSLVAYVKLYERGRVHLAFPSVLVRYAVAQYRGGRRVGTPGNSRDLFSPLATRRRGVHVNELDPYGDPVGLRDVIVENKHSTPADIAAFRIDFAAWMKNLPQRQQRIARLLAIGETTSSTARRFGVSDGRISQIRRQLERSWHEFHGETAVDEASIAEV